MNMPSAESDIENSTKLKPRQFAIQVAEKLQQAGYQGLWAGGCVRDQLLGLEPKDYDVATNATPEQVRDLFGHRRTIAIGAAFGVITVRGPRSAGQIEVATFRRDLDYTDGRRPDSVEYTDAREDAMRRDFTINGLFYDPVKDQVIDYVEGRSDLDCRIVRAIGNPHERIYEDKLRMLRAVRFAATYGFELDSDTQAAIAQHAAEITVVSAERIGNELRRMLTHRNRAIAARLLAETSLLDHVLEDGQLLYRNRANWRTRCDWLRQLGDEPDFVSAAAVLLSPLVKEQGIGPTAFRWKLSNAEQKSIEWLENNLITLSRAHQLRWSRIQPLLIHPDAGRALKIIKIQFGEHHPGYQECKRRLQQPHDVLDPPPLLGGEDLIAEGLSPGPEFSTILNTVRAAQLDGEIKDRDQAFQLAREIANSASEG